jgi:hypothetical protein
VEQPGLYKTSLYSRGKDAIMKDFKLKTLIHSSLNTEHPMFSSFLYQIKQKFMSISLPNQAIIVASEVLGGGSHLQKQRTNV